MSDEVPATTENPQDLLGKASDEQIDSVLAALVSEGSPEKPSEPERPTPEPPVKIQGEEEEEKSEGEELEPDQGNDSDDEGLPKNFRFHVKDDPNRQRFFRILKREPGVDPVEAWRRAGGKVSEAPVETRPAEEKPSEPDPLKNQRDKISELKAQLKEARESYENEKADEISDQLVEARLSLAKAEDRLEREGMEAKAFDVRHQSAREKVLAEHPDAVDPESALYDELARERAVRLAYEPEFFKSPEFPIELIEAVKARRPDLFPQPKAQLNGAPAKAAPVLPKKPARPVGSVAPGNGNGASFTRQTAEQQIAAMSPEQLDQVLTLASAGR